VTQYRFDPALKSPVILSVGRLSTDAGHKRHDALLRAWSNAKLQLPGWELVIAGAAREGESATDVLRERANEIGSVRIEADISREELSALYGRASIYWHAAGFERPSDRPDLAEHFGMSTVEAMSAGAVPVVYRDGGQIEIVEGSRGRFWTTLDELVSETVSLAHDPDLGGAAEQVSRAATAYNREAFRTQLLGLVVRNRTGSRRGSGA
jgi:glycosyltransferase involved in cell wall biosynthesis